ncbi:flagellar hook-length control protein FliK [Pseudoalteromonas prydzensis]|uniref:flagellar hook-length control protein FliK n=1 Tax=Pseudoalteromonas prydzensis TaxID=182141 RepID=UPI0007E4E234|nr:flagellar hook-length control protein FliK [Pseudoalteromonas prydzensis]MBE0378070.1 flagellar hook-length control protein FliK [Pseudoalteromonas prydzensis ACAM 620]
MKGLPLSQLVTTEMTAKSTVSVNFSQAPLLPFDLIAHDQSPQSSIIGGDFLSEQEDVIAFVMPPLSHDKALKADVLANNSEQQEVSVHVAASINVSPAIAQFTSAARQKATLTTATDNNLNNTYSTNSKALTAQTQVSTKLAASLWMLNAVNLAGEGTRALYSIAQPEQKLEQQRVDATSVYQDMLTGQHQTSLLAMVHSQQSPPIHHQDVNIEPSIASTQGMLKLAKADITIARQANETGSDYSHVHIAKSNVPQQQIDISKEIDPKNNSVHTPLQNKDKPTIQPVISNLNEVNRGVQAHSVPVIEHTQMIQQWRTETLSGNQSEWGQRLLNVLHDKVNLQIGQQVQRAQIRLDPPNLGSIDISISIEAEKTTVHIVASNPQIREAMQQTLEQLRQSLVSSEQSAVAVDISDKHEQQQQSQHFTHEQQIKTNQLNEAAEQITSKHQQDWLNRLI